MTTTASNQKASLEGMKSPMEALADQTGLPLSYTNDLVDDVTVDILLSMQVGADAAKKVKIQAALKSIHPNGTFLDDGFAPAPHILVGCPGHGKTSVLRAASRRAAGLLDMNFLDNPPSDQPIGKNDYVFLTLEFAGQNSALMIRGIPYQKKDEQTDVEYMDWLKERAFANMEKAGGGTLLLDDIANANVAMMNVALPILAERRFNRTIMKSFYMAATGNLGSLDGTKTTGYTSAMLNRGKVNLVRDKVEDLAARLAEKYGADAFGDCFFSGWLIRGGQAMIETVPMAGSMQNVATPRSIDNSCQAFRIELMKVGGPTRGQAALNRSAFDRNVGSLIGKEAGDNLVSHLHSAYEFADPAARMMILEGKLDDSIAARMKNANAIENIMFFEQFGQALADYTSFRIKEGGDFKETITRFTTGALTMDGAPFTGCISLFKDRLVYRNPSLSSEQGASTATGPKRRILTEEIYDKIIDIMRPHPDNTETHWTDIVSVLSEAGLYSKAPTVTPGAAPRQRTPKKAAANP